MGEGDTLLGCGEGGQRCGRLFCYSGWSFCCWQTQWEPLPDPLRAGSTHSSSHCGCRQLRAHNSTHWGELPLALGAASPGHVGMSVEGRILREAPAFSGLRGMERGSWAQNPEPLPWLAEAEGKL